MEKVKVATFNVENLFARFQSPRRYATPIPRISNREAYPNAQVDTQGNDSPVWDTIHQKRRITVQS